MQSDILEIEKAKTSEFIDTVLYYADGSDRAEIKLIHLPWTTYHYGLDEIEKEYKLATSKINRIVPGSIISIEWQTEEDPFSNKDEIHKGIFVNLSFGKLLTVQNLVSGKIVSIQAGLKSADKNKLTFDQATGTIMFADKRCEIPTGTNQEHLCKAVFKVAYGTKIKEMEVLDMIDWAKDANYSDRTVYDAVREINKRALNELGIKDLLISKGNHVWINIK